MMNNINEDKAVARLAEAVAQEYVLHPDTVRRIGEAAELHDIGKLYIPKSIIYKPGKLTKDEFAVMKTHTLLGVQMLNCVQGDLGIMAREIALNHHEKWNGGGYWGRHADELPFYVPIVTIADIFIALISERSYKAAWPCEKALEYIENQSGILFNPALVKNFLTLIQDKDRISAILNNNGTSTKT